MLKRGYGVNQCNEIGLLFKKYSAAHRLKKWQTKLQFLNGTIHESTISRQLATPVRDNVSVMNTLSAN